MANHAVTSMTSNERFAAKRRTAGVSQARLAMLIGVYPNDICQYELGNRPLSSERVAALEAALLTEVTAKVRKAQEVLEQLSLDRNIHELNDALA